MSRARRTQPPAAPCDMRPKDCNHVRVVRHASTSDRPRVSNEPTIVEVSPHS